MPLELQGHGFDSQGMHELIKYDYLESVRCINEEHCPFDSCVDAWVKMILLLSIFVLFSSINI